MNQLKTTEESNSLLFLSVSLLYAVLITINVLKWSVADPEQK